MHAARTEIGRVHPRAARPLEEVEAILAQIHNPQVRRERADVEDMRSHVEHMVADAGQFGKQHAQILRADRHFEVQQLLDGEHIGMLHRQRRTVIEPVEIGQRLKVGLVLDQLFGAAVEQADMRIDPLDHFAVQLHHHAQHAVRRRVLGAEIDRVIGDDFAGGGQRFFALHGHFFASPAGGAAGPFSSPGSTYSAPSHGERKSNVRISCASSTGSYTTRFSSSE